MGVRWLYFWILIASAAMVLNVHTLCRYATELPAHPVSASLWATYDWLLILVGVWTIASMRRSAWLRRARAAPPPQLWAWQGTGDPVQLTLVPFGIDPYGCPAWRVSDLELPVDASLMVSGLTPHAAIYVAITDGVERFAMARLEADSFGRKGSTSITRAA